MLGGPLIKIARQRAGLTQRELAEQLGLPQSNIARWESGARQPTIDNFVEAVRACGLDPVVDLYPLDRSNDAFIWELLDETPARRLQMQVATAIAARRLSVPAADAEHAFDPKAILRALEHEHVEYVLLGTLAENLRGAPILPTTAEVVICPRDTEPNKKRLDAALGALGAEPWRDADHAAGHPAEARQFPTARRWWVAAAAGSIAWSAVPHGTTGFGDLAKNATEESIDRSLTIRVAAITDLIRIAGAAGHPADRVPLPGLRRAFELANSYRPREERPSNCMWSSSSFGAGPAPERAGRLRRRG